MQSDLASLEAARSGDEKAFARLITPYRRELRAHCYRMSGSVHDADDLLQESLVRAWRGLGGFEGRSSLRTWLYRVTTHACLDALEKKSARLLPMDLGPALGANVQMGPPRFDPIWLEPCPAEMYDGAFSPSPEARHGERESVAFAFLAVLQLLPPKQRAVLILRDVLGWQATECAELLELSVAAVNSALQRARQTLETRAPRSAAPRPIDSAAQRALLARYVEAWEMADVSRLVSLLHEDATLAMPPLADWIAGAPAIAASIGGMVFGPAGPGAFRFALTESNGLPSLAAYQRDPASGEFRAAALHLIHIEGERIAGILAFLDPAVFAAFGLPAVWDASHATP